MKPATGPNAVDSLHAVLPAAMEPISAAFWIRGESLLDLPDLWPKHLCSSSGPKCWLIWVFYKSSHAAGAVVMICNRTSPSKDVKRFIIILIFCRNLSRTSHLFLSSNSFSPLFCFPCHSPQRVNWVSLCFTFSLPPTSSPTIIRFCDLGQRKISNKWK